MKVTLESQRDDNKEPIKVFRLEFRSENDSEERLLAALWRFYRKARESALEEVSMTGKERSKND